MPETVALDLMVQGLWPQAGISFPASGVGLLSWAQWHMPCLPVFWPSVAMVIEHCPCGSGQVPGLHHWC